MKSFLRKILIFLLLPLVAGIVFILLYSQSVKSKFNKYRLAESISELYIGDSHFQKAICDSLLENSRNMGASSESYYYSYYKLKFLADKNPNIKKIYLSLSYHNLSDYYDEFIFGPYAKAISPRYFFILPVKEQLRLLVTNMDDFLSYFETLKRMALEIREKQGFYPFLGGFANPFVDVQAKEEFMDIRIADHYYKDGQLRDFAIDNLYYFGKIIELCVENEFDLVFLNPPVHAYYYNKIPPKYLSKLEEITKTYPIRFIDYGQLDLVDSLYIPDGDHLSYEGARLMTLKLKEEEARN